MKFRIPYFDVSKVSHTNNNTKATTRSSIGTILTGKQLGSGQFGTVYQVAGKDAAGLLDHVDTVYRGSWKTPPSGKSVVVKIMKAPDTNTRLWLKNALRELYIQYHLSVAPSKVIKGKTFDVKKYVPQPYFGGYVRSSREFVIVMRMQPGKTLNSHHLKNKDHYLQIERAFISMLLNNVVHMDFHAGNIMVTDDGNIHLIDFGGAMLLSDVIPKLKLKPFKKRLYRFISLWPKYTTYVTQAKNINHAIFNFSLDNENRISNELGIWPQSPSNTMLEMRGMIQKRNNITNLSSRKLTNAQRKKMYGTK
jgi:serine/threonine protein kinase